VFPIDRIGEKASTIAAYQHGAAEFVASTSAVDQDVIDAIDAFAGMCRTGAKVLEIGSASGRDADLLEQRGVLVDRTDITPGFVDLMLARGRDARVLDPLTGDLGGPYDGVWANAVLLHLSRDELPTVLHRLHAAVRAQAILYASVKRGRGDAWSTHGTITEPRHFTFWDEPAWLAAHQQASWNVQRIWTTHGRRNEVWINSLASS
jgi:SAM-dependent methyltransferase